MPLTDTWQRYSVQARAKAEPEEWGPDHVFNWLVQSHDLVAPWWSRARDADLRDLWPSNDYLSGTVYTLVSKLTALPWKIVPQDNTIISHVRLAEELAYDLVANSEMGEGWIVAFSKWLIDHFCLAGATLVQLGGERLGKTKKISQIVKDRDPGPVLSVDKEGHLVERFITEWHTTPLGDRRWWWIARKSGGHSRDMRGGLFLTEDHPMLTDQGWLPARDIKPGMQIATSDSMPSEAQAEVLVGTLLGDGCLGMLWQRAVLRLGHGLDQEAWLQWKQAAFKGFQWTGYNRQPSKEQIFGNGKKYLSRGEVGVNSRASAGLHEWRQAWYPKGKKVVARDLVERYFGPRMLATWFCDDGSLQKNNSKSGNPCRPGVAFYTNGFTKVDCEWLAGFLSGNGLETRCGPIRYPDKEYWALYLKVDAAAKLFELIGPYVPPCMRYKLPETAPAFDPSTWSIEPAKIYFDEVVESRARPYFAGPHEAKTTYHIGVEETRTFVAAGMVSHNTQDGGSYFEIYGPGRPSGPIKGAPLGIAHLDSGRCCRTGSPEFPVVYTDTDGKKYKMHRTRVMFASSLPSPITEMHGVGLSAISRSLMIARNLSDMLTYESEMYGSRPVNRIILGKGITGRSIMEAFSTAEEQMNAEGLTRFAKSVAIGSTRTDIDLSVVPLSTAPVGYDRRSNTDLGLYTLALAFGVDARELWPATSSGATKADALVQAMKARGKGPGQIIQTVEMLFNSMFLPPYLKFTFDLQDDEEDQLRAAVKGARATCHAANLGSGSVSVRVVREQMMEDGDLSLAQFRELELGDGRLEDGSDVVTLFYSPEQVYRSLLALEGFEDVFSIDDPAVAVEAIGRKALEVQERMMQAKPTARFQFKAALAALSALREVYVQREQEAKQPAAGAAPQAEAQAEPQKAAGPEKAQQEAATPQTAQGSPGVSSVEGVSHVEREMKAAAGLSLLDGLKARVGRKPAEEDEPEIDDEDIDEQDIEDAVEEWRSRMPERFKGILEAEGS